MGRSALIRITVFTLAFALVLSFFSLLLLNRFVDTSAGERRAHFYSILALDIEQKVRGLSYDQIRALPNLQPGRMRPPGMPPGPPPGPPPHGEVGSPPGVTPPPDHPHRGPPPFGPENPMWLVGANGEVLNSNTERVLPESWRTLPKPDRLRTIASKEDFFRLKPGTFVMKLDHPAGLYLILKDMRKPRVGPILITQVLLSFFTVVVALSLAVSITFVYLRRKSREASAVLLRLEQGDLAARFHIQRFDEFGGLLLDFNRMAGEIEKLVGRISAAERARKRLLQELGHDLRTPLTSLKTSFETLREHFDVLPREDRTELFDLITSEVDYFKELVDKLITIAALDEPHYKKSTELADLREIAEKEVRSRESLSDARIEWAIEGEGQKFEVLGDPHLLQRLVKNALDNTARYAQSKVILELKHAARSFELLVKDDGPGVNEEVIQTFGTRREFRGRTLGPGRHFSLGLGSVIMKAIAELHGGSVSIANRPSSIRGAQLVIRLPAASANR